MSLARLFRNFCAVFLFACAGLRASAGTFTVATYNVETYLDQPAKSRSHLKTPAAKAKIRESIKAMNPDVIALEEIGSSNALQELQMSLRTEGQDFGFSEYIQGFDTNIHVAVLSKLLIVARRPHTNEAFLLDGRRFEVKRGFAELDIQAATNLTFTLLVAHLKSRLITADADEAEERLGEARVFRGLIDERLARDPQAKLVVLGDFNDARDSPSIRTIMGRGKTRLFDTRPAEQNSDNLAAGPPYNEPRNVAWTYFYGKDDTYGRIDYILSARP